MAEEFDDKIDKLEEESDDDFDLIEVTLNENEIDTVIAELMALKETKSNAQFPLASDLDLLVNYENDLEAGEEDE